MTESPLTTHAYTSSTTIGMHGSVANDDSLVAGTENTRSIDHLISLRTEESWMSLNIWTIRE